MEASSQSVRRKIGGRGPGDLLSNRRNGIIVAVAAAVLAGLLILVFVQQYRHNVNKSATNTPVFVASSLIPRGTAGSQIAAGGFYKTANIKSDQVAQGAIANPAVLKNEVAATDIYPGQQLTAADFTTGNVTVASQLTGAFRAIAVPIDASHGLVGFVKTGDHVDVLASGNSGTSHPIVDLLAQNVLVLNAPSTNGGGLSSNNNNTNIVLKVTDRQALAMAAAADNGKVWITLRPPVGATQTVSGSSGAGG